MLLERFLRRGKHTRRNPIRVLTDRVNSAEDESVVLSHILEGVSDLVDTPTVWIAVPTREGDYHFSVVAVRGESAPPPGAILRWSRSERAVRKVEFRDSYKGGPESGVTLPGIALPMEKAGEVVGLLCVGNDHLRNPGSPAQVETLQIVCNHAALAMANVRAAKRLREMWEELEYRVEDQTRSLLDANERLRKMHEEAERLATVDGLTGLRNHRYFWQRLCEETARAKRFGRRFSLLFMDVNGLKTVNDRHGHLVGDRVLQRLGEAIGRESRSCDVAARYGGDEFVILLAEAGPEEAASAANRLRASVSNVTVTDEEGKPVPASLSLGTASYPRDGETELEMVHAADQAAYRDKRRPREVQ